jgi:hypothetical protein
MSEKVSLSFLRDSVRNALTGYSPGRSETPISKTFFAKSTPIVLSFILDSFFTHARVFSSLYCEASYDFGTLDAD